MQKVEALIKLFSPGKPGGYQVGDIITIQPVGTQWGEGDLMGRTVVVLELPDLPCGADFMVNTRCSGCEHQGIKWASTSLSDGDVGNPKLTCPKEKYSQADVEFVFMLPESGAPNIRKNLKRMRRANVRVADVLSNESLTAIAAEDKHLTSEQMVQRLTLARKASNLIGEPSLEIKTILSQEPASLVVVN